MRFIKVNARLEGDWQDSPNKTGINYHPIVTRYFNVDHLEQVYQTEVDKYVDGKAVYADRKNVKETVTRFRFSYLRELSPRNATTSSSKHDETIHHNEYEALGEAGPFIKMIEDAFGCTVCDCTEDKPEKPTTPEKE